MKIEVHESAIDSIKAMGQRDKERIERLELMLKCSRDMLDKISAAMPEPVKTTLCNTVLMIDDVMVNSYSTASIQKAK